MTTQRNHYEVLGVSTTAPTDQIKTKYRELARKFHPDVVKDKALGQKVFTQINQAYRILADPERRAQYDAILRSENAANHAQRNGAAPAAASPAAANVQVSPSQKLAVNRLVDEADFALMNGDAATAQAQCEAALRADPQNAKALGLLGDALQAQGRREEAAAAYRRSLKSAPSPMIQAKLSRLETSEITPRTNPMYVNTNGTSRTVPPSAGASRSGSSEPASGGLFGKLLGKKR